MSLCLVFPIFPQHNKVILALSALKNPAPSLPPTADGEWETTSFFGSWVEGRTAGGSRNFLSHWRNPCFPFTVSDESDVTSGVNVRISLHQNRPDTDLLPIGFHVYKVRPVLRVDNLSWGHINYSVLILCGCFNTETCLYLAVCVSITAVTNWRKFKVIVLNLSG